MTIFIDSEFKCHLEYKDGVRAFDTNLFDTTLPETIECFRYIPPGETWHNGSHSFSGEMITPWKDHVQLAAIQAAADRTQAQADEEIGILLDTIEELIIGG